MFRQHSSIDKLAIALSSCILATAALMASLKLAFAPTYSDFIVGNITWQAHTKFQDLVAAPVFVAVFFFGIWFFSRRLAILNNQAGRNYADELSTQLLWWSIPSVTAITGLSINSSIDPRLFLISAAGLVSVAAASGYSASRQNKLSPLVVGLSLFAALLISLVPLEIALALGRVSTKPLENLVLSRYIKATYLLMGIGLVAILVSAYRMPERLARLLPALVLLGQIGLPVWFLTLYPARLKTPDGGITTYATTYQLKLLLFGLIFWGILDVVCRYGKFRASKNKEWGPLFSPLALFALLIAIKAGKTVQPHISPDDYHFGERLLGWWSYLQSVVPYIGYVPAHGLMVDDWAGFLSFLFYDGTAGSIFEAERLGFALLALVTFISIHRFSGNIGLAFVSTIFLGMDFKWLFLTPFICLWCSRSLMDRPARWLSVWLLTAPVVVLGIPPQGLLLVAASGIMAIYYAWRLWRCPEPGVWKEFGISGVILLVAAVTTPLVPMLFGAIRYVLENGPINQLAYGVPWMRSWDANEASHIVLETVRMSWVAVPMVCLTVIQGSAKNSVLRDMNTLPAIFVLIFVLLLIPYSMGRIDPGSISRPGHVAILGWAVLIPIITWRLIKPINKSLLILVVVSMGAALMPLRQHPLSQPWLKSTASAYVLTGSLKDGQAAGMPNLGIAAVQDDHWDRLTRLNALLNSKLPPGETYLDLTSRNAHYFYLGRQPTMAVAAPYNMVPLSQQQRAVEELSRNVPRLALLEANNITHDGGGLALRTPLLYRFVVENYVPALENGFIVGYPKEYSALNQSTAIHIPVKNLTNAKWNKGLHRHEPAIVLGDSWLTSLLSQGMRVRLGNGDLREITKVSRETNVIWLDGAPLNPSIAGFQNQIEVGIEQKSISEFRVALFEKAFAIPDFGKIPVAWGRSEKSLLKQMALIKPFDSLTPATKDLATENASYKVTGDAPRLEFDVATFDISGRDAGLLRFDFSCFNKTAEPRMQVFWRGDGPTGPAVPASLRFTADNGTVIVPLDASPRWLTLSKVRGIGIGLENATACHAITIRGIALFQRVAAQK